MRPSAIHPPTARRADRLAMDFRVAAVQRFEYRLVEPADVTHAENGRQLPFLVIAVTSKGEGSAHLAIAVYLVAICAAPFMGAYPVPMIGYGLSPILGYFVALAWSVRNQAAPMGSIAVDASSSLGETA